MKIKKEIITSLENIIPLVNAPDLKSGQFPYKIISAENKSLTLSQETAEPFNLICSKILRNKDWEQKFSQKLIEKKVESLIIQTHEFHPDSRDDAVSEMLKELEVYQSEQEIVLPVFGIKLDRKRTTLGTFLLGK